MKAGLLTLHRVYNYGSVLQAYATQRVFREHGCDCEIVDYITAQRTKRRILWSVPENYRRRRAKTVAYLAGKMVSVCLKELAFGGFIRRHMQLSSRRYIGVDDLMHRPLCADVFVTGSDQVWNSEYNEGVDRGFWLDFLPESTARIAFAASFGKSSLADWEVQATKRLIRRYSSVSVREQSALNILHQLDYHGGEVIVDPTLQLPRARWLALASKRLVADPYVMLMLLYNEDDRATEYARAAADRRGLKLVKLSWELKRPRYVDVLMTHRSPGGFLSLVQHAELVVTNSFHGVAFCVSLNKPFVVFPRRAFQTRIDSILNVVGLEERLVRDPREVEAAMRPIDFGPVNEVLRSERERASSFLRRALSSTGRSRGL